MPNAIAAVTSSLRSEIGPSARLAVLPAGMARDRESEIVQGRRTVIAVILRFLGFQTGVS